jgi:hypothetical protein
MNAGLTLCRSLRQPQPRNCGGPQEEATKMRKLAESVMATHSADGVFWCKQQIISNHLVELFVDSVTPTHARNDNQSPA